MAVAYLNLEAGTIGALTNGSPAQATSAGATSIAITSGTLSIAATATHGVGTRKLVGSGQSVSGVAYYSTTLAAATDAAAFGFTFELTALGTIGAGPIRFNSGTATLLMAVSMLSTEQYRIFSASGATLFTSTFAGGFVVGTVYRFDGRWVKGTTATDGTIAAQVCLLGSTVPLAGTSYSATNVDTGLASATSIRQGTRAATGTADDSYEFANYSVDVGAVAFTGPRAVGNLLPSVTPAAAITNAEPGSIITTSVTATDSDGTIASYAATAPGLTLTGTGSSRTFRGPLSLSDQTYTVTWTVTDNSGGVTTVTQSITVLACTVRVASAGVQIPAVWLSAPPSLFPATFTATF